MYLNLLSELLGIRVFYFILFFRSYNPFWLTIFERQTRPYCHIHIFLLTILATAFYILFIQNRKENLLNEKGQVHYDKTFPSSFPLSCFGIRHLLLSNCQYVVVSYTLGLSRLAIRHVFFSFEIITLAITVDFIPA